MSDFSQHPPSLSEIRAQDNCNLWTPRELLIHYLRRIDNGEFVPDALLIMHVQHRDNSTLTGMKRSKCTVMEAVALCEIAKHDLLEGTC